MRIEELIDLLNREGFSAKSVELNPDGSERTLIITHEYTPNMSLGSIESESIKLKEDVLPPGYNNWHTYRLGEFNDAAITQHLLSLKRCILTQDERMRRQRVDNIRKYFDVKRHTYKFSVEAV